MQWVLLIKQHQQIQPHLIHQMHPPHQHLQLLHPAAQTPQNVTISQLYSSSIPQGTYVKVTGKVLQSDSSGIRIENSDDQDILVEGSGLSAYEDQSVTVIGTYSGPSTYTTVMGGDRTVPTITDATIA